MKIKNVKIKKIIATFLGGIILTSSFTSVSFAAVNVGNKYNMTERNTSYLYTSGWGDTGSDVDISQRGFSEMKVRTVLPSNETIYCLEFGKEFSGASASAENIDDVLAFSTLNKVAQDGIKLTSIYGYPNYSYGVNADANRTASQLIMWEYQQGYRIGCSADDPTIGLYGSNTSANIAWRFYNGIVYMGYDDVMKAYTGILKNIANHNKKPSFTLQTAIKLRYNQTNRRYETTVVDTNDMLQNYDVSTTNTDLNIFVDGNSLTLYSSIPLSSNCKLVFKKKGTCIGTMVGLVSSVGAQTMLYGSFDDPVISNLTITTDDYGSLKIIKQAEDNNISNVEFSIENVALGYKENVKTTANGEILINNLIAGFEYTISELYVDNKYLQPDIQTFTATSGTQTVVTFNNVLKKATLEVTKKDGRTNKVLEGATYAVYKGTNSNGDVYEVIDTNNEGKATLMNMPFDTYCIKEIKAPKGYVLDEKEYVFSVTTDKQIVSYTFDNFSATGVINIQKKDKSDNSGLALSGAKFDLYARENIPNTEIKTGDKVLENLTTNENGIVQTIPLSFGKYYLIETVAPKGFATDTSKEYDVLLEKTSETATGTPVVANVVVENEPVVFNIIKTDLVTAESIPNAKIIIYNELKQEVFSGKTNEKGFLRVTGLSYGKYTFKEIVAPDGYVINTTLFNFEIIEKDNKVEGEPIYEVIGDLNITNEKTKVTLQKVDETTNLPIPNVSFDVFLTDTNEKINSFTTDENGKIDVFGLKTNIDYYFIETQAAKGYYTNKQEYHFSILDNGDVHNAKGNKIDSVLIFNKSTHFEIIKIDSETKKAIQGVVFKIYDDKNELVYTETTNENGQIIIDYIPIGTYYFKEVGFPIGYIHNANIQKFEINSEYSTNNIVSYTVENVPTSVVLNKIDKTTGKALKGSTIAIRDKDNNEVFRGVTNENGQIATSYLPIGTYTYQEILSPDGYQLNRETYEFTINSDGTITNGYALENAPTEVIITKVDKDGEALKDAKIGVYDEQGTLVFEGITNDMGQIVIYYLKAGNYTYKELIAPEGYKLNKDIFKFTINSDGSVDGENVIVNVSTSVVITKLNNENQPLAQSTIEVFDENKKLVFEGNTDEKGQIIIFGLVSGKYTYKEVKSPNGYKLNTTVYEFEILSDGTVDGENVIINQPTEAMITKLTEEGKPLQGSTIGIFDLNNNMVFSGTTDENGIIVAYNLPFGDYTYKELSPSMGYELNQTIYHFTINQDGSIDGDNSLINKLTKVIISKFNENGVPLANATIGVYLIDGTLIFQGVTDENGQMIVRGLKEGTYYFMEIGAPVGYILDDSHYEFAVDEFGKVTGILSMINKFFVEETIIPKTNDTSLLTAIPCITLVFSALYIAINMIKRKQKNRA